MTIAWMRSRLEAELGRLTYDEDQALHLEQERKELEAQVINLFCCASKYSSQVSMNFQKLHQTSPYFSTTQLSAMK